jgi:hypothetical protein
MPNDQKSPPGRPLAQIQDVNYQAILIYLVIVVATVLAAFVTVKKMYHHFEIKVEKNDQAAAQNSGMASTLRPQTYFPMPREQPDPRIDLKALREREDRELASYGWVNRPAGIVRIPIERAMQLIVERGLPVSTNGGEMRVGASFVDLKHTQAEQAIPSTNNSEPAK